MKKTIEKVGKFTEDEFIEAFKKNGFNLSKTQKEAGISRNTFYSRYLKVNQSSNFGKKIKELQKEGKYETSKIPITTKRKYNHFHENAVITYLFPLVYIFMKLFNC